MGGGGAGGGTAAGEELVGGLDGWGGELWGRVQDADYSTFG